MVPVAQSRYAEILRDVERLIDEHVLHHEKGQQGPSKLRLLVPSVGIFYTPLHLERAFCHQDERRRISHRRFVPPSFNDIRVTLNTAQLMGIVREHDSVQLVTFDGDVTLYDDGQILMAENPVIPRIIDLLREGRCVAIVTAAGYTEVIRYYERLRGLLNAVKAATEAEKLTTPRLLVMGGECNFLFDLDLTCEHLLRSIPRAEWELKSMEHWTEERIQRLLDVAQGGLEECIHNLNLSATVIRKTRAVGIIPTEGADASKFTREQLEETVLVTQQVLERTAANEPIPLPFCVFNGGNDVFVDVGDKALGVQCCQAYLGGIEKGRTLHIGDQFLSAGANDFKARLVCATAWIANPTETVQLLDELAYHHQQSQN